MSGISKKALFNKLNKTAYETIESSYKFCVLRGNPHIELSHWITQILQLQDSDIHRIIKYYGMDENRLQKGIMESLEQLSSNSSHASISEQVVQTIEKAWIYGSLELSGSKVRTGYLIIGMLETRSLRDSLLSLSREFKKIDSDELIHNFNKICGSSPEGKQTSAQTNNADDGDNSDAISTGEKSALESYASNLTEKAKNGEIDPVVGRDEEIRQIIDILMRRRQNNPILTGEAGVGKTAVVEGFALRVANGDVPPSFKNVALYSLDVGSLQAGASMKGEFEERLKSVIEEVQASETPIILFIDEAHTLIGAGGAAGTGDAANLLKPALARGTLRTIAATTWAEYKKYFEKDPALTRRFQVVKIDEPDEVKGIQMMRCLTGVMEAHHKVLILDEALEASVKLSHRYIPARQLPDKSISVLDTACARVGVSQHATPSIVEDHQKELEMYQTERDIIQREQEIGIDTKNRLPEVEAKIEEKEELLTRLKQRWEKEKALVDQILDVRGKLQQKSISEKTNKKADDNVIGETPREGLAIAEEKVIDTSHIELQIKDTPVAEELSDEIAKLDNEQESDSDHEPLRTKLHDLQDQLIEVQGDTPLVLPTVNAQAIASVIADWTGIPMGSMVKNELNAVLNLGETLGKRVLGQQHSLDLLAQRIRTTRAGLESPDKPIGVFMLAGPSGIGKTETALALAEALYGGEESLITINMSEFQESHTVSTLKGSPPGYVGYGEGGILTEAVRRRPYSVVLLDEIEKAHPDVHEIFFQVFDKGWMDDAEGRYIDFRNTVILLTTNAGSEEIHHYCDGKSIEERPNPQSIAKAIRDPLRKIFPAALLGRLDLIPYYPLSPELLKHIIKLKLNKIEKRIQETYHIPFTYDDEVVDLIGARCTEVESGARVVDGIISNNLLPRIGQKFLESAVSGKQYDGIHIAVKDEEFQYGFIVSQAE